ncbi:hypothetical protein [Catalinimonas alkaloidigena]|uniref:hypothetical protein n=1 Tax=Catalinimonas alkaloidigena TaxID=1075417 RepID=UPI0024064DEE|nr:hypothetical protein [Catalinimonas alkaloidigena]
MADNLAGITYVTKSIDAGQVINVFVVRVDARLNEKMQRLVLAHEMIHVKQYVKGELEVLDENEVFWNGRKYYGGNFNSRKTPWESEAYHYDRQLANMIEENLPIPILPLSASNRP